MCKRQKALEVELPRYSNKAGEGMHIVIDSTGLKVFGEGEWKVRQHGYSKRRTWRKLQIALDVSSQEIVCCMLTSNDYHDKEVMQELIPPRKDACIKQHGNHKKAPLARDEILREIRRVGRKRWKQQRGYHQRSLVETAMFRLKTQFGDRLCNRIFEHQATEAFIRCRALNMMTRLGLPDSYVIN